MCFPLTSCSEGKTITISLFLPLLRCPSCLAPGLKGSPGCFAEGFLWHTLLHLPSILLICFLCSSAHTLWTSRNITFEWLVGLIHAVTRSILDHSCYIHVVLTLHHPLLCLFFCSSGHIQEDPLIVSHKVQQIQSLSLIFNSRSVVFTAFSLLLFSVLCVG